MTTATKYINRSVHTENYTVNPNYIVNDESLTKDARIILLYLLSKPANWKFRLADVKRAMSIGGNKVYKCLKELCHKGYAFYKRGQSKVEWFFFDKPQNSDQPDPAETHVSPDVAHRVNFEHVKNQHELESNNSFLKNKEKNNNKPDEPTNLKIEPEIIEQKIIVVVSDEIKQTNCSKIDVESKKSSTLKNQQPVENIPNQSTIDDKIIDQLKISSDQKSIAKKILSTLSDEMIAKVVLVFTTMLATKEIKNPIGYLTALTNAAKNGTLTTSNKTQELSLDERLAKQKKQQEEDKKRWRVDNEKYFKMLKEKFGYEVKT